jgi:hypothetical protein
LPLALTAFPSSLLMIGLETLIFFHRAKSNCNFIVIEKKNCNSFPFTFHIAKESILHYSAFYIVIFF